MSCSRCNFCLFSHFYKPPAQPPQKQNANCRDKRCARPSRFDGVQPAQTAAASPAAAKLPATIPAIQASDEKTSCVESPLYRVELSNRGAVVRSWKLKKYFDDQTPPHPLDLVDPSASQQLGWPFSLMLPDTQLESQANSALYQVTPSAGAADGTLTAPADITFHWSDGHLDITKKLSFSTDYELSVEASRSLDGKPIAPVGIAWRGGFGDRAVYKASQLVSVFYQTSGKLSLLQYKKLGVPSNQSQPAEQPGSMEFLGIEDQFFTAAFIPEWHGPRRSGIGRRYHTRSGGSEPEAEMAAGTKIAAPLQMRVYVGPKDLALLSKVAAFARSAYQFRLDGNYRQAAAVRAAVAAQVHSELRLGDRAVHAGADDGAVSHPHYDFAFHAENAGRGAGNSLDSGPLQEILDERSAQTENERRGDGAFTAARASIRWEAACRC